jgi:hypothetical protein
MARSVIGFSAMQIKKAHRFVDRQAAECDQLSAQELSLGLPLR